MSHSLGRPDRAMRSKGARPTEDAAITDPQDRQTWLLERLAGDVAEIRKVMFGFWWLAWLWFAVFILSAIDIL